MEKGLPKKQVVFATLQDSSIIWGKKDIKISKIIINNKSVVCYKTINIKKAKKLKRISVNMYLVEDEKNVYYVLASNDNPKFDTFISVSNQIPEIGQKYNMTRLMYNYGGVYEDKITTSEVKYVKKLADNLYKIKTRHTYYVLISK